MTPKQKQFLFLAMIKQVVYSEIELELNETRQTLSNWWGELKNERQEIDEIRSYWKMKCDKVEYEEFEMWFKSTPKYCHYCKVTQEQLNQLRDKGELYTKRNRGYILEIERKRPDEDYDKLDNLVFACYWCNNAKTDTFTEEEFMGIGQAIAKVWEDRLVKPKLSWADLKFSIQVSLKNRGLKDPAIRLRALDNLEIIISKNFMDVINDPSLLKLIEKNSFKSSLAPFKQNGILNGAEKSIVNEIYKIVLA